MLHCAMLCCATLHYTRLHCSALQVCVVWHQVKENQQKPHFTSWHGLLGLVTVGYSCLQLLGGATVKYHNTFASLIRMRLADHKMTHAVSGVVAFTLVTATLMCALFTDWLSQRMQGLAWYVCSMAVCWMALVVMNQVTSAYAARFTPKARK